MGAQEAGASASPTMRFLNVRSFCNMAIKIIKEGKKKLNIYQVTCGRCQCVFECDERDATINPTPFGRRHDLLDIYCPNCRAIIVFENKPIRKELL